MNAKRPDTPFLVVAIVWITAILYFLPAAALSKLTRARGFPC